MGVDVQIQNCWSLSCDQPFELALTLLLPQYRVSAGADTSPPSVSAILYLLFWSCLKGTEIASQVCRISSL